MTNYSILPDLEKLRSCMAMVATKMLKLKDKEMKMHGKELDGATDIVQNWIENIREGK